MRDKIELFLSENPSKSFRASEVAKRLKMPDDKVERRLRELVKKRRAALKRGRYSTLKTGPGDSAVWMTRRLEETARRVGISAEVLQRWVEERRRRASEEETKKLFYAILNDVEKPKGMMA
jgi:hypothetical protein